MNIFDISIILTLIMFFIVGWKRGIIKEAVSLIGIILVFGIAFLLKGRVGNLLATYLPFIPFKGKLEGITSLNLLFYQVIAFILLFIILLVIYEILLKISKWVQKIVNMTIILLLPSKILGGILSFLKGYIIVFAIMIVLMVPLSNNPLLKESKCTNFILYKTPILSKSTNNITKALNEIYDLGKKVKNKKIKKEEANKQALEILLKYYVVDEDTVDKLIKDDKFKDMKNVHSIEDVKALINSYEGGKEND